MGLYFIELTIELIYYLFLLFIWLVFL